MYKLIIFLFFILGLSAASLAQSTSGDDEVVKPEVEQTKPEGEAEAETPKSTDTAAMTLKRMQEIVLALDEDAQVSGSQMSLTINEVQVIIVTDPRHNRMRAFSPIRNTEGMSQDELYRLMQANFDAALDARYAVAHNIVLSVFIHPLGELKKNQFIEGLGQVVNLVKTYGTAYTSGAMTFGGGDSRQLHRKLIDDLLKKGQDI